MKTLLLLSALLPGLLSAKTLPPVLAPVESPPKIIDGLEFSVVTQAEWRIPEYNQDESIVVQLRVTNRGDKAVLFPTFDSFHAALRTPEGKVLGLHGGRDGTLVTSNILLQPGQGFSLQVNAMIKNTSRGKDKDVMFILRDGTGSFAEVGLAPGDYSIFFGVHPTPHDFEKTGKLPAPLWSGKGISESIGFKVVSL